jgi:outer membrane biogenesis lipoprotein LolB
MQAFTRGRRVVVLALLVSAFFIVSGCASTRTPDAAQIAVAPATSSEAIIAESFVLAGRMSVRQGSGADARVDTVRIEWQHAPDRDVMRFFSPFGSQLAEITATPLRSTLSRGDAVEHAASFAALTRSQLGVAIDARLLARWVQGVDTDKTQRIALSGAGAEKIDDAREWTIKTENVQTLPGASRFRYAARLTATDGETTLRLVVDQFSPQ